jgi:hypothetical protein
MTPSITVLAVWVPSLPVACDVTGVSLDRLMIFRDVVVRKWKLATSVQVAPPSSEVWT